MPFLATMYGHTSTSVAAKDHEWVRTTMQDLSHFDLLDPTCETVTFPLPTDLPISDLPVFDGYVCVMCSFAARQL